MKHSTQTIRHFFVRDGKATFCANRVIQYKKEVNIPEGTSLKLYVENSEVVEFDDIEIRKL